MLLLIPWIRFCLDTRLVSSHELVSRDMQEASLPYPTLTPPEEKKNRQKKQRENLSNGKLTPPPPPKKKYAGLQRDSNPWPLDLC